MRQFLSLAATLFFTMNLSAQTKATPQHWAIALHGGAGVIERKTMDPKTEAAYRASLAEALHRGSNILGKGGSSLDAVEAAIRYLEDDPLFNAGKGAVFTADGHNELDAAIMDGATLKAGAVAGVTRTKNPITLARAVMDESPHVMLIGPGADSFAAEKGLQIVDPGYFFTERRWDSLVDQLTREGRPIPPRPVSVPSTPSAELLPLDPPDAHKYGTVGVVARDRAGDIAAGTSTGGVQAKRYGRVGDSPIIGAGTYASNASCAVSATGAGEYFIRLTVAREICALVEYKHLSVQAAADDVVHRQLPAIHGDGGVIVMAPDGQLAWSFNTPGMYRARLTEGGKPQISIYADEP